MNLENVKALADLLNAKGLSAIEVGEGENRIRIERDITGSSSAQLKPAPAPSPVKNEDSATAEIQAGQIEQDITNTQVNNSASIIEIKSPLVGVYYAAPSPEAETFVSIGSKVKKGDVLCIIETMKLMNEITAEQDGEVIDICIKNGDIAEYGQVLFKMQ
ncbi:MAG: acetyl-CoA carboxylase biotin carboxyl carrier protein [Oscillospiraceae bacterium]|nr:acetyl-CoA carboxylase biotin carboxyl carrier protein [Oscillospiraceae bacterium]